MIEDAVRTYLLEQQALTSLISTRLHLTTSHESTTDYIVIHVITDEQEHRLHDDRKFTAYLQVNCYSNDVWKVRDIMDEVNKALDAMRVNADNLSIAAKRLRRQPDYDRSAGLFAELLDYQLTYQKV